MRDVPVDRRCNVADEETVCRLISFPGCVKEDGRLTPETFSLYHKNEDYVSVIRREFVDDCELDSLGVRIKKWMTPEDKYCGYCHLAVRRIRTASDSLEVIACYSEKSPQHAGIVMLKDNGGRYTDSDCIGVVPEELLALQMKLCKIAEWCGGATLTMKGN